MEREVERRGKRLRKGRKGLEEEVRVGVKRV